MATKFYCTHNIFHFYARIFHGKAKKRVHKNGQVSGEMVKKIVENLWNKKYKKYLKEP